MSFLDSDDIDPAELAVGLHRIALAGRSGAKALEELRRVTDEITRRMNEEDAD